MTPIIEAKVLISGGSGFDPVAACKEIGISPAKIWKLGEKISGTIRVEETNGCLLSTGPIESYHLDEVLEVG